MPRTLALLRHAKSAWPDDVVDHERPLNKRGRRDAPEVGRWLKKHRVAFDLALVSTAVRAQETYELLAAKLPGAPDATPSAAIYGAGAGDVLDIIRGIDEQVTSAILVGHNPTFATLAGLLDDQSGVVDGRDRMRREFPTSSLALFEIDGPWESVNPGEVRLVAFAVPRG